MSSTWLWFAGGAAIGYIITKPAAAAPAPAARSSTSSLTAPSILAPRTLPFVTPPALSGLGAATLTRTIPPIAPPSLHLNPANGAVASRRVSAADLIAAAEREDVAPSAAAIPQTTHSMHNAAAAIWRRLRMGCSIWQGLSQSSKVGYVSRALNAVQMAAQNANTPTNLFQQFFGNSGPSTDQINALVAGIDAICRAEMRGVAQLVNRPAGAVEENVAPVAEDVAPAACAASPSSASPPPAGIAMASAKKKAAKRRLGAGTYVR